MRDQEGERMGVGGGEERVFSTAPPLPPGGPVGGWQPRSFLAAWQSTNGVTGCG